MFNESDRFKKILQDMTGKTVEDIVNEDFPTLTAKRDASRRSAIIARGSVRLSSGRFITAKEIVDKHKK